MNWMAVENFIMGLRFPTEAILKSKSFKEKANTIFKVKVYRLALNRCDKFLQFMHAVKPKNKEDVELMDKRITSIQ